MNTSWKVIGLMSGTSLDGLDIACCDFSKNENTYSYAICTTSHIKYDSLLLKGLKNAIYMSAMELSAFDQYYGNWLGKQVNSFVADTKCVPDFIASHGHTVHHQPQNKYTIQIGSGQEIAIKTGIPVVCDFRSKDVALGGQGAPLVPIGDQLLFSDYDCCLNLGGIANLSFNHKGNRIAYDIAPVNMLLNHLSQKIEQEYDDKGQLAAKGTMDASLLNQLNSLPYYEQPFPKSLGYEWFTRDILPIINNNTNSIENLLYTSVIHISQQIVLSLNFTNTKNSTILITGGGAKNTFLINTIKSMLNQKQKAIVPDDELVDFKEALIFAFLGVLASQKEINCIKSVTGAKRDSSSGVWFYP